MVFNDFIGDILNYKEEGMENIRIYFEDTARAIYRKYLLERYGHLYEEHLVNNCMEKIMMSIQKFKGESFEEFKCYSIKIIKSTILNYMRDELKTTKLEFVSYENEETMEYLINKCSNNLSTENIVINKIMYENFIKEMNFSKREMNVINKIRIYGSLKNYKKLNKCNYNAMKQTLYRIRLKVRKKLNDGYDELFL